MAPERWQIIPSPKRLEDEDDETVTTASIVGDDRVIAVRIGRPDAEQIVADHNAALAQQPAPEAGAAALREELADTRAHEHVLVIVGDMLARHLEWMIEEPTTGLVPEVLDAIKERAKRDVAQWRSAITNAGFRRTDATLATLAQQPAPDAGALRDALQALIPFTEEQIEGAYRPADVPIMLRDPIMEQARRALAAAPQEDGAEIERLQQENKHLREVASSRNAAVPLGDLTPDQHAEPGPRGAGSLEETMDDDQERALERRDAFGNGWVAGQRAVAAEVTQFREALGAIQTDLINCQTHRPLCVHEQDALKIANEALLSVLAASPQEGGPIPLLASVPAEVLVTEVRRGEPLLPDAEDGADANI